VKPELTQAEFQEFVNAGKTAIWQYNTLYQIDYSPNIGNGEYYLRKVCRRASSGMGVTRPGRFIAMRPEIAETYL